MPLVSALIKPSEKSTEHLMDGSFYPDPETDPVWSRWLNTSPDLMSQDLFLPSLIIALHSTAFLLSFKFFLLVLFSKFILIGCPGNLKCNNKVPFLKKISTSAVSVKVKMSVKNSTIIIHETFVSRNNIVEKCLFEDTLWQKYFEGDH